jgi:hypothetical protein
MGIVLRLVACLVLAASIGHAQTQSFPPSGGNPVGAASSCGTPGDVLTTTGGTWVCAQPPGAGSGAPAAATYWVRTADATLSAESIMGSLGTGLVINTTTTGAPSIYAGGSCTNQFVRSTNASGALTCASVATTDLGFDTTTQAEFDAYTGRNLTVALATTADITLSGEQTIDGVLTSTTRILVNKQTLGQNNGCRVTAAGAWGRCTDFDTAAEYLLGRQTHFRVTGGTTQAGTIWEMTNTSAITLDTTPLTFAQIGGPGNPSAAIAGLRSIGSTSTTVVAGDDNRLAAMQTPSALSAASQITCTKPTQLITGSGGAVTLTDAAWLVNGTFAGQSCELENSSTTNTVTAPTTATIIHCGGTGSVVIGKNHESPLYVWTGSVWQQKGCMSLQRAANAGKLIDITGTQLQLREGTSGFDFKVVGGVPVIEGIESGGLTHIVHDIPAGKDLIIRGNGTEFERTTVAGVQTYSNAGRPRGTLYWDAAAIKPDGTHCLAVTATVNSGPVIDGITCAENAAAKLSVKVRLPDRYVGGDLFCRLTAHDIDTLGHVSGWDARAQCRTPGTDTINATWSSAANVDVTLTTANIPYSSSEVTITPNGTCLGGDMMFLELNMDTTANTDDGDAVIEGLTCEFLTGSKGD